MSRRGSICICGSDEHELYFIPDESEPTSTLVVKSIGRRGVGYVTFFECVQIPADDLYTGVHIDHGSIEIREESGICSPFNRPASVTFENVWNLDEWRLECTRHGDTTTVASSHDESDPVALSAMYSAETGIFRFAVSGFSKYKLCLAGSSSPNGQSSDSKETFSRQQNSAATHSWAPSYERRPQVVYSKSESSPLSDFLVSDLLHNLASAEVYSPDGGPLRFPPDVGDGVSHWRIHFLERLADNSQRTGSDELDGALSESEIDVREASQTPESSTALFDLFFEEYIAACEIKRCNGRIELIPPRGSGKYLEFTAKQLFRVPFDSTEAMHLWIALKLICALWGAGSSAGQAGYKADRPETAQAFLSWLKDVLPHFNSDKQDYHDDMYHSVFQRMADLNLGQAALIAKHRNNDKALAELIGVNRENRHQLAYQVAIIQLWNKNKAAGQWIKKILLFLSGSIFVEDSSACENMDWLHCFAMCAYYVISDQPNSLEDIFKMYEDCCIYDLCCVLPVDDDVKTDGPPRILYSIIRLYLGIEDITFVRRTEFVRWNAFYKWIFLSALYNIGFDAPVDVFEQAIEALVSSLVLQNKWEYAVALLLHYQPCEKRDSRIRKFISSNMETNLSDNSDSMDVLSGKLLFDKKWIIEGKAMFELECNHYVEAARLFTIVEKPEKVVDILINKIFLKWKRGDDLNESLLTVMESMEPYLSNSELPNNLWYATIFETVLTYCHLKQLTEENKRERTRELSLLRQKLRNYLEEIRLLLGHPQVKCRDFIEDVIEQAEELLSLYPPSGGVIDLLKGMVTSFFG